MKKFLSVLFVLFAFGMLAGSASADSNRHAIIVGANRATRVLESNGLRGDLVYLAYFEDGSFVVRISVIGANKVPIHKVTRAFFKPLNGRVNDAVAWYDLLYDEFEFHGCFIGELCQD